MRHATRTEKLMNGNIDPNDLEKMRQIEEMKKKIMMTILSKDAYERLARVKVGNPQIAGQAELYLLQIYQTGKLQGRVSDEQMKEVLKVVSSGGSPTFNIRRK
jgi:programmed cell death protein 5